MSGTPLMMPPLPQAAAQGIYESVTTILGFQELASDERLQALQDIAALDLLSSIPPGSPFLPVNDGDTAKQQFSYRDLASTLRDCLAGRIPLMIGSCDADVSSMKSHSHD
jgi:hypothetical protein